MVIGESGLHAIFMDAERATQRDLARGFIERIAIFFVNYAGGIARTYLRLVTIDGRDVGAGCAAQLNRRFRQRVQQSFARAQRKRLGEGV